MGGMGLFLHFLLNVYHSGNEKTYPTEREVRKIIIDSKVPAIVGANVSCLEGIPVKLVKVYVYRSGCIMVYMII